jgi:ABC-type nitrate/sulfonate/bicarbonate transport system permease component
MEHRFRRRLIAAEAVWLPSLCAIVLLTAWEVLSRSGLVSTFFISSPTQIFATGVEQAQTPAFLEDLGASLQVFALGYGLGVLVAVPLGLVLGRFRRPGYMFEPWLDALNATPRVALLPLVILWFGIGLNSKVAIVFLGVFVSVVYNAYYGVRSIDRGLENVTRVFGASKWREFLSLVWPSSVPFVLVGMRLGIGRGVAGLMIAEFFASNAGIGHYIFVAGQAFRADRVLFGAIVLTVLALICFGIIGAVERRFESWRPALREV